MLTSDVLSFEQPSPDKQQVPVLLNILSLLYCVELTKNLRLTMFSETETRSSTTQFFKYLRLCLAKILSHNHKVQTGRQIFAYNYI